MSLLILENLKKRRIRWFSNLCR